MYVPQGEAPHAERRRLWESAGLLISLVVLAFGLAVIGLAVDQTVRALTGRSILTVSRGPDRPFEGCAEDVSFSEEILLPEPSVVHDGRADARAVGQACRPADAGPPAPPVTLLDTAPGRALVRHVTPEKGVVLKWFVPKKYVSGSWFVDSVDHIHRRVVLTHSVELRRVVLDADPWWASGAGPRVTLEGLVHEDKARLRVQTAEGEHVADCGPGDIVWGPYRVLKTERSPARVVIYHEDNGRELTLELNELALMP